MKKLILMLLAVLMMGTAMAQNDFPRYGFWSNWSAGVGVVASKNFTDMWGMGQGTNIGADIRFVKQLNYKWQFRIIGDCPGFIAADTNQFDRYAKGMIGFAWYPWAKHFYMYLDGGAATLRDNFGYLALAADAGIGLNFNIREHSTIFAELGMDCVADFNNNMTYDNVYLKLGYAYRFGLTKLDKEIDAQRAAVVMVPTDIVAERDMLAKRTDSLISAEKLLVNKIICLENHDSMLHVEIATLKVENDSLRKVIDNIADNRTNFYALPFSVQFDVDSYVIKASEKSKIKAIANMMASDTTMHFTIAGFCDNTGSDAYNMKLSEKRANAVKDALVRAGVKDEQLTVSAYGKSKPFFDAKYDINRRVSFFKD